MRLDPADALAPRPKMNAAQLLALSFLWFPINMFWTAMLQHHLPSRVQELAGEAVKGEYLGYISVIGAIATTLIQLIIAPLSDNCTLRLGRRHPFIVAGILLNLVAMAGFATVGNYALLVASFLGIQLFLNVANGPYQALLPDNIDSSQEGIASAYMGGALLIGQLVAAVLLILLQPFGDKGLIVPSSIIMGVLLLAGMAVTVFGVPDRPALPSEQAPLGKAMADLMDWRIRENPDFYGLLSSRFFINLAYFTVVQFLFFYLQDSIGLKEKAGEFQGYILLTVTLAALVGTILAGRFLRTYSKKQIVFTSCAFLLMAALFFAFSNGKPMVLILAAIFGLGWGAFQAVDWALAVNLLPEGGAAKYMAIWHVCMTVPQILAPLFGKAADMLNAQYGSGIGWRAAMLTTVIYLVIGTLQLRGVQERPTAERESASQPVPTS